MTGASDQPAQSAFARFEALTRRLLSVPKEEVDEKERKRKANKDAKKPS